MLKVKFVNNNYVTLHVGNRTGYLSDIIQAKIVAQGKWHGLIDSIRATQESAL